MHEAPVDVGGLPQVYSAGEETCILQSNQNVACAGRGTEGQIGDGRIDPTAINPDPVKRVNLDGPASSVVAGSDGACAVLVSGALQCWGARFGSFINPVTPPSLEADVSSVALAGDLDYGCGRVTGAVKSSGDLYMWGENTCQALGVGDTNPRTQPTLITSLAGTVVQISLSMSHGCAVLYNGSLACWGQNDRGEVGVNDTVPHLSPVLVTSLTESVLMVSLAYGDGPITCAILTPSGKMMCWGGDTQLGNGVYTDGAQPFPIEIISDAPVQQVSLGGESSCALYVNGTLVCWGYENGVGEYEDGYGPAGQENLSPVPVTTLNSFGSPVKYIRCGGESRFGVLDDGRVFGWGSNGNNELGINQTASGHPMYSMHPMIAALVGNASVTAVDVSPGDNNVCALLSDGTVTCWGYPLDGATGMYEPALFFTPVELGGAPVVSAGVGSDFAWCVGWSSRTMNTNVPLTTKESALLANGSAACWGGTVGNEYEVLPKPLPVVVPLIWDEGYTPAFLTAVNKFVIVFARNATGHSKAQIWGSIPRIVGGTQQEYESRYRLFTSTPLDAPALAGFTVESVAINPNFGLMILTNGTVLGWGPRLSLR